MSNKPTVIIDNNNKNNTNIDDESFVFLTHNAKEIAIQNSNECHNLKIQQLPIKTTSDSSHFVNYDAAKTLDNNVNTFWKAVDIGHDRGEWISYETPVDCYPVYADILFKHANKRKCNFIVSGLDTTTDPLHPKEINMFIGGSAPSYLETIPFRALLNPVKTKVIKIKVVDYSEVKQDASNNCKTVDTKHTYPNPEIQEVRFYGYVLGEFNPKKVILPAPFHVCPEGYYKDVKTGFCTPKLEQTMVIPTAISSYSSIVDDSINKINKNENSNDIRNLIKLPLNDKYSIKGVGSIIWQEFDHSDTTKYKNPAILESVKLQAFQCPVRDYKILVRIHDNVVGLKTPNDFDSKTTTFQKIVNIQCGNGAPVTIPLDGYNDALKNTKKTVSITMLGTSNKKQWFSMVGFHCVGKREIAAPAPEPTPKTIPKPTIVSPPTINPPRATKSTKTTTTTTNKLTK
jgi:hypothetical protein